MSARLGAWRLLALRGLREHLRWALGLAAVVAVSAAAAAAFPPLYADGQDAALREELAAAAPRERDVEVVQAARLPAVALPRTHETRLRILPPSLRELAAERELAVDTPVFVAHARTGSPAPAGTARFLTLRSYDDLERVRVVEGAAPRAVRDGPFEIALSQATAAALSVVVGDTLRLEPNPDQPALQDVAADELRPVAVRVAGIFRRAGEAQRWFGDVRPLRPQVQETETQRLVFAHALAPREAYARLLEESGTLPFTYLWRYRLDARRVAAADLPRLETATRTLALRFPAVAEFGAADPAARTGLGRILDRFREQQRLAGAGLSFAAAALLGLALVVVLAVALADGGAQRRALTLARDRGAPAGAAALAAAAAVVLPGALAGWAAAAALAGPSPLGALLAALLGIAATIGVAAAVAPRHRPPQDPVAALEAREALDRRRAAVESTLVVLALSCVAVLRSREQPAGGFDPLAALTPVLVVLAAAALALRLAPPAAAFAAERLRRRADLAPALALRRVAREGALGAPALAVPLVAAAVTVFAALTVGAAGGDAPLLDTLRTALGIASWLAVAYAAAAVGMLVLVLARTNADEDARLTALGLRRRPRLVLALAQFVPPVLVGTLAGAAAGALAHLAVRDAFAAQAVALGQPVAVAALLALPLVGAAAALAAARRRA